MEQTANYGLRQWAKTDRIQMEDFNSDNAKIDAALKASADAIAAVTAAAGNCKVWTTGYTGNGTSGNSNPRSVTFPSQPAVVLVMEPVGGHTMCLFNGTTRYDYNNTYVTVSWSGNTVKWYASSANEQFNVNGYNYRVVALLTTT